MNSTEKKNMNNAAEKNESENTSYGMKWHKFLVNFALFAAAIWNIFMGVLHITGIKHWLNTYAGNAIMIPEEMYINYPPLPYIDRLYALILFAMAVYQILIRFMLKNSRKYALLHLNIMIGIMCFISAIYDFLFQAFVRNENFVRASINYSSSSMTLLTAVIVGTGLCIANWYYYKKRRKISK